LLESCFLEAKLSMCAGLWIRTEDAQNIPFAN
jgi:hypothetical protein